MKKIFVAILLISFLFSLSADEPQKLQKFSRTKTEWVSLAFIGGNIGFGGNISFFTVRWKHFYWEIFRFQGTIGPKCPVSTYFMFGSRYFTINGRTMIGLPLFITSDNRREFRFALGVSGGWNYYRTSESILTLPLEISYLFHTKRYPSIQIGISVEIPLVLVDPEFFPVINGFLGLRF